MHEPIESANFPTRGEEGHRTLFRFVLPPSLSLSIFFLKDFDNFSGRKDARIARIDVRMEK